MAALFGITGLGVSSCNDTYPDLSSLAPANEEFVATLVGTNEVPAVTTTAAGRIESVQEDSVTILYDLSPPQSSTR